jgi:Bacterial TniB protein
VGDLKHLSSETQSVALLPSMERIDHLNVERWIGYTRANQILAQLESFFTNEPGKLRPKNLLIVSPSNNGKTMIAEKFVKLHPQRNPDDGNNEIIPVLELQMPSSATNNRFYNALLTALNTPVGFFGHHNMRETLSVRLMRTVGVRMLIIDEVHNLLDATARRQREMLNLLRYIGNDLRIPIVCLGIREAYLAIRSDDQLENRFHPVLLPLWEPGLEYARLLASFETILPLREPSQLSDKPLAEQILRRSEGTIGEICALLTSATTTALMQGEERITTDIIDNTDYNPPRVRRRIVEMELR